MFGSFFNDKNVLIWGYGLEGKSALELLVNKCVCRSITIATKDKIEENIKNVNFILENDILKYKYDVVIKSSGISAYKEEIKELEKNGSIITSNLNILLSEINEHENIKTIGITGTKGKSTTSSMMYHILKSLGHNVAIAGNIGISFLDLLDNLENYNYIILELSSYQCQGLQQMLDYGVVLNLFPEHIDWHLSHENYYNDKLNIIKYSRIHILNHDAKEINVFLNKNYSLINNSYYFNFTNGFYVCEPFLRYYNENVINIKDFINIKGEHIFKNICSILTVLKNENINILEALRCLKTFKTLNHRLEIFYKNKETNTIFVDDSISTIPEATIEAIKTFNEYKKIFLILGGFDRQQNYDDLINKINSSKNVKKIFLLGQTGLKLKNKLENSEYYNNLESIIADIFNNDIKNTAVILSPAAPSYDMFENFKKRGELFKTLVNERQK